MRFPHSLSSIFPLDPDIALSSLSPLFLFHFDLLFSDGGHCPSVGRISPRVQSIYRDINVFNANYTSWMHTFLPLFASRLLFFAECTDKLDVCSLFQIVFHTHAGISMRTTEKAKILPGAAFYFQFVFICPSAPHGCLWERVSTCFIGRYCVSGSKSVFTHRCESRTSVSVPLLFVSGWNYLGVNGFVCLPLYM